MIALQSSFQVSCSAAEKVRLQILIRGFFDVNRIRVKKISAA
jgi:hypothetical protein